MKKFNPSEKQAFKQQHPKKEITGFKVIQAKKVVFEHARPQICWNYIRTNNLKNGEVKPT